MGKRLAAVTAFGLVIALGSSAWAQNERGGTGNLGQNQGQGRDQDRGRQSDVQTIRGVVAGVTAEGETVIDYGTNQAVMATAAFLTVVAPPSRGQEGASDASSRRGDSDRRDQQQAGAGGSDRRRADVYIVWLTPRTKVYEASGESGRSDQKKEVTLDRIEVGDRVEVQLSRRDESAANAGANSTEQMRRKHGRHRTAMGNAVAITILPPRGDDRSSAGSQDSSKRREEPDRDK